MCKYSHLRIGDRTKISWDGKGWCNTCHAPTPTGQGEATYNGHIDATSGVVLDMFIDLVPPMICSGCGITLTSLTTNCDGPPGYWTIEVEDIAELEYEQQ